MRYIVIFLLVSFGNFAQRVRPFVGVSGYIDSDFIKSGFADLKAGTEYNATYYLKPEIEINYMFGVLEKLTNRDDAGLILSEYSKKVSAVNFSLCPKIILGNKGDDGASGYLQILPKYTYSKIEAQGYRLSRNSNDLSKPIEERENKPESRHSLGIGIGYVFDLSDENPDSIALNIYFNNIDLGNALNMLKQDMRYKTNDVIGFGVNYYFSLKKKNK
jgi:hypothetical protein